MLIEKQFDREYIPNLDRDLSREEQITLLELEFDDEEVYDIDEYEQRRYLIDQEDREL